MRSLSRFLKFRAFLRDTRGTVAIITALAVPVLLLAMLGGTTIMKALAQRRELQAIAQTACNRAVKPQRLAIPEDADRQMRAQALFDNLAQERGFAIQSRTVTSGWLTAQVSAHATVPIVPGLSDQVAIPINVTENCAGIPPYPRLGDVVLSSDFRSPSGASTDLTKDHYGAPWAVFPATSVGWDGGTGPGVEIQDWTKGFELYLDGGALVYFTLPNGVSNPYVVELDSNGNSSMFKNIELRPGTYRFSFWYIPRSAANQDDTNRIAVYLEGTKPIIASDLKLEIPARPYPLTGELEQAWKKRHFEITVSSYGLYRLTVAAEGLEDTAGGLFNDLKLEYIKRPAPEYNDPTPPIQ